MSAEAELHAWLHDTNGPETARNAIDPASIVRRSKRRRLPKQLAVGGATSLAVVGIGVASVTGIRSFAPGASDSSVMSAPEGSDDVADEGIASGGIQQAPASKLNLCGGELAEIAPSSTGLVLTPDFAVSAPVSETPVAGTVTLTNTGTKRIVGTTGASPVITVSQDGVVLWHSNGPMIMIAVMVDLAPGQSMEYPASFTPVRCDVEDDMVESFRENLPALSPGGYQLSAAIDLVVEDAPAGAPSELVTGPVAEIVLH